MRLTLVRPNLGDYRSSDAMPPLAMGILAARAPGWDVSFFDEKAEELPEDDRPDLAALSVETFTAHRAYAVADAYRTRGVPVVMGGYHPTFLPDEALQHADAVIVGDAEGAWERLLDDFRVGRLQRRYGGGNETPLTDYRLERSIYRGKRYAPVELVQFGRGCRFACDFCSIHSFYGTSLRVRPLDGLISEIESLPANRLLFFVDDNLFGRKSDLLALLAALEPLHRRWCCQISIDVARDEALLDRMQAAGCRLVIIGFESLNPESLEQMGKGWNQVSGSYQRVVRALHGRGIGIYGTFVFGYDADTRDSMARTLDFALESRLEIANFNPLTPTPCSALYDRLLGEGRLLSPQWWLDPGYRYGDAIFAPRGMRADELVDGVFEARKRFYSWRSIGLRVLDGEVPFSPFHLGMTTVGNLISRREIYKKQHRLLGT
ncbi:MAG: B12-binding domain-containing radical SAM protein [Planctomycetes bacterium]|nr:B12-binding domain-containing radical SAM protein [Planctomycetota bacterium]